MSASTPQRSPRPGRPHLSIVIPAFNEAARIVPTLDSIATYLEGTHRWTEVIVVDDGSTDDTAAVVEATRDRFVDLRVLRAERNGGKGRAVRMGMLLASGDARLFMDADNSTDVREVERLLEVAEHAERPAAIVIGSIALASSEVTRAQGPLRRSLGRLGNGVVQRLVLPGIADSQRGFKLFSAAAANAVFPRCRIDGWGFDVEALAIGRALGFDIVEVPVRWHHEDHGRVRPAAYVTTLVDVLRIRRRVGRVGSGKDAHAGDRLRVG